jgi:ribosomal protein S18 acetylase RimI-like enzyme
MTEIIKCDFNNSVHREQVLFLLDSYMQDPMGGGHPMPEATRSHLLDGLANHGNTFILFALYNGEFIGLVTCFINFSTFKAKPYINIHDVVVLKQFRGMGIGRALLQKIIAIAQERDYCKVTLEVRDDNQNAQGLYKSLGFRDCDPPMYFWEKMLKIQ